MAYRLQGGSLEARTEAAAQRASAYWLAPRGFFNLFSFHSVYFCLSRQGLSMWPSCPGTHCGGQAGFLKWWF